MLTCKRINPAESYEEPEAIIEYVMVSLENTVMVRDSVPADQASQVEEGDEISVYAIDELAAENPRRFTIWYNKGVAAVETPEGSIWGDWEDEEEMLLTEEFAEAEDINGATVGGRIAHNLLGQRGIYFSGDFYLLTDAATDNH